MATVADGRELIAGSVDIGSVVPQSWHDKIPPLWVASRRRRSIGALGRPSAALWRCQLKVAKLIWRADLETQMFGYGLITTRDYPQTHLDNAAWSAFRDTEPLLRLIDEFHGINPFTKERIVFSCPGSAEVVRNTEVVGRMIWEAGRILLDGDPQVLTPLAIRCATALGAIAQDEDGAPLPSP